MRYRLLFGLVALLLFCGGCSVCHHTSRAGKDISPLEFGLRECKTDIERYKVLLVTHRTAIERGVGVDYSGIKKLNIEVPDKKSAIPLAASTDFRGCVLNVMNTVGDVALFTRNEIPVDVSLSKSLVDGGKYSSASALRKGLHLLIINDKTPWVENRAGHDYPAYRKDVVVVKDGRALNSTVMPYNSRQTTLACSYVPVRDTAITISNVVINRTKASTKKTFCFSLKGVYNVQMSNVTVNTPEGTGLWADGVIKLRDCARVTLDKVRIQGTYSLTDKYGYGFDVDNVYDLKVINSYGHGNWGVFGTNNLNKLEVRNSDLNRVDIHLYGRDVRIADCKLSGLYNQFSGVYGDIVMERCVFDNFTPLINGTSYNAYVPFNLYIKDCEWTVTKDKHILLGVGSLKNKINTREELSRKAWPNIYIDGLKVNISQGVAAVNLINVGSEVSYTLPVDYLEHIDIKNVEFNYSGKKEASASLVICNSPVNIAKRLSCMLENVCLINGGAEGIAQATVKYVYPGSVTYNLHSSADEEFSVKGSTLGYNVNSCYQHSIVYDDCTLTFVRCTPSDLKEYAAKRRTYRNCRLYLNNADSKKFYLDNLATYSDCELIPCSDMEVDFIGNVIDVNVRRSAVRERRTTKTGSVGRSHNFFIGHFDGSKWIKD